MKKVLHLVVAGLIVLSCGCVQAGSAGVFEGRAYQNFNAKDLDGKDVSLDQSIGDGPVLLVFFATWCPPCRKEVPELIKLNDEFKDKGLKIVATSLDNSVRVLPGFIKKNGINYTVWHDGEKAGATAYEVKGIPTNILIDSDGTIQFRGHHPPSKKEIESLLES